MTRRTLISIDQATPTNAQHKRPCSDCPWRRDSIPGWLGGATVSQWIERAHGEVRIDCHVFKGPQCAGAAIYRANVCKTPRDGSLLQLPADKERVFGFFTEFSAHHDDYANGQQINWKRIAKRDLCDVLRDFNLGPSNLTRQDKAELVKIAQDFMDQTDDMMLRFAFGIRLNGKVKS